MRAPSDPIEGFHDGKHSYLQYAHVRLCSIQRKAAETVTLPPFADIEQGIDTSLLKEPKAHELILILAQYPDAVRTAMLKSEPSTIVSYCWRLSHAVSSAYEVLLVKGAEKSEAESRLFCAFALPLLDCEADLWLSVPHGEGCAGVGDEAAFVVTSREDVRHCICREDQHLAEEKRPWSRLGHLGAPSLLINALSRPVIDTSLHRSTRHRSTVLCRALRLTRQPHGHRRGVGRVLCARVQLAPDEAGAASRPLLYPARFTPSRQLLATPFKLDELSSTWSACNNFYRRPKKPSQHPSSVCHHYSNNRPSFLLLRTAEVKVEGSTRSL